MRSATVNELVIQTPEGIQFGLTLAGPFMRFLAWVIDVACIIVLTWVAATVTSIFLIISPDLVFALHALSFFLIAMGYGILLEWFWRGQTIGKRLFRLRVMDELGLQLQFNQVALRNLLRMVDMLPVLYLTGGITCFLTQRNQRLGDLAAGTVVTRTPPAEHGDFSQVLAGKYNSFREYPHLQARLRQHVPPEEARLALEALMRRDELDDHGRIALFQDLADHFRGLVRFPEESTVGLTSEQYLRNVVDTLYSNPRNLI